MIPEVSYFIIWETVFYNFWCHWSPQSHISRCLRRTCSVHRTPCCFRVSRTHPSSPATQHTTAAGWLPVVWPVYGVSPRLFWWYRYKWMQGPWCRDCADITCSGASLHQHPVMFVANFGYMVLRGRLTLRLLMSYIYICIYIYGAPSKARNANVVYIYIYIWTYVWQRWNSLFLFSAQCFNTESMQRGFLCHICV